MHTKIRPLEASDHDAIFRMEADPDAVFMAAFTANDPSDRDAFEEHLARTSRMSGVRHWVITDTDDQFAGTISVFPSEGSSPEVTYWIDRSRWGQGFASQALELVLLQTPERPVIGRCAADNVGSRRVLEKAGFEIVERTSGFANARNEVIEEFKLVLA